MKRGKRGRGRKSSQKQSLNLPDLDQARSAVLNSHRLLLLRTQIIVQ